MKYYRSLDHLLAAAAEYKAGRITAAAKALADAAQEDDFDDMADGLDQQQEEAAEEQQGPQSDDVQDQQYQNARLAKALARLSKERAADFGDKQVDSEPLTDDMNDDDDDKLIFKPEEAKARLERNKKARLSK